MLNTGLQEILSKTARLGLRGSRGVCRTREKRKWPVDLMGGARHSARQPTLTLDPKLRQTILDTEQLLKDDEPTSCAQTGDEIKLDYYDDGYPKLPERVDRRAEPLLAQVA